MSTIGTNTGALGASYYTTVNNEALNKSIKRLASGSRLAHPSDDAAGVAVSANLTALMNQLSAASSSSQDMISFAQTADGFMSTVQDQLTRMSTLAQQASNGAFSQTDRENYNVEFNALKSQIDMVTANAQFDGSNIFTTGTISAAISNSATETFVTSSLGSSASLSIQNLTIGSTAAASAAIGALTSAISSIASRRAEVNADISTFNFNISNLNTQNINTQAANSRIADLDMAAEVTRMTSYQILQQAGIGMLSQANTSQQSVLTLMKT